MDEICGGAKRMKIAGGGPVIPDPAGDPFPFADRRHGPSSAIAGGPAGGPDHKGPHGSPTRNNVATISATYRLVAIGPAGAAGDSSSGRGPRFVAPDGPPHAGKVGDGTRPRSRPRTFPFNLPIRRRVIMGLFLTTAPRGSTTPLFATIPELARHVGRSAHLYNERTSWSPIGAQVFPHSCWLSRNPANSDGRWNCGGLFRPGPNRKSCQLQVHPCAQHSDLRCSRWISCFVKNWGKIKRDREAFRSRRGGRGPGALRRALRPPPAAAAVWSRRIRAQETRCPH